MNKRLLAALVFAGLAGSVWLVTPSGAADPKPAATQAAASSHGVVIRTYNLEPLLNPHQAYVLAGNADSDAKANGQMVVAGPPPKKLDVDDIVSMIKSSVDSDSWRDNGGDEGSIHTIGSTIVISNTVADQEQIAQLLKDLTEQFASRLTVRTDAYWLRLSADQLSAIDSGGMAMLTKIVAEPSTIYCRSRLIGFNRQSVAAATAQTRVVVNGVTPVVAPNVVVYDPTMGTRNSGVNLQIFPAYDPADQTLIVDVQSSVKGYSNLDPEAAPRGSVPATQPASTPDTLLKATLDAAEIDQQFNGTVRLKPGVPLVIGGMSEHPGTPDSKTLCLVLVATVDGTK